jgi:hypothetical protein
MLKKIIIAAFFFPPLLLAGQVTINVQLPPAGMIQKDQLWNLVVVNNNSDMMTAISLELRDAVTGQTVLSGGSRSIALGRGVKVISARDVQPVLYNYEASGFTGAFLPLGSYVACYRVFKSSPEGSEPAGDECVQVNISPLSPPLLAVPFDRDSIPTVYPAFSWLPPSPMDMFSSLSYDIAVAEVSPGQSPAEAILYNTPVYTSHNLQMPYHSYPPGFSRLREGQQYAWQVTARNGLNYAAQTEVWSFVVKPRDSVRATLPNTGYILLKGNNQSGLSYISGEDLFIKYYSFDKEHETVVRFYSAENTPVREIKQKIVYGDNFLHFKLGKQFDKGKVYAVQIADRQKNVYAARFSIK